LPRSKAPRRLTWLGTIARGLGFGAPVRPQWTISLKCSAGPAPGPVDARSPRPLRGLSHFAAASARAHDGRQGPRWQAVMGVDGTGGPGVMSAGQRLRRQPRSAHRHRAWPGAQGGADPFVGVFCLCSYSLRTPALPRRCRCRRDDGAGQWLGSWSYAVAPLSEYIAGMRRLRRCCCARRSLMHRCQARRQSLTAQKPGVLSVLVVTREQSPQP